MLVLWPVDDDTTLYEFDIIPLAELPSDCIVAVSCSSSASTGRLCAASAAIRQSLVHMQRGSSTTLRTCRGKGLTFCSRLKATCVCHRLASSTLSRADRKVQDAVAEANHTLVDRVSQENIQAVNSSSDEPETDLPAKLWDGSTWHRPGMDKTRAFTVPNPWFGCFSGIAGRLWTPAKDHWGLWPSSMEHHCTDSSSLCSLAY